MLGRVPSGSYRCGMCVVMLLVVLSVQVVVPALGAARRPAAKATTATVVSVDVAAGQIVLNADGKELKATLEKKADIRHGGRKAALDAFQTGEKVVAWIVTSDGATTVRKLWDEATINLDARKEQIRTGVTATIKAIDPANKSVELDLGDGDIRSATFDAKTEFAKDLAHSGADQFAADSRVMVALKGAGGSRKYVVTQMGDPASFRVLLRGHGVAGRIAAIDAAKKSVTVNTEYPGAGTTAFTLSSSSHLVKESSDTAVASFRAGDRVVAVPSGKRGQTVYLRLLADTESVAKASDAQLATWLTPAKATKGAKSAARELHGKVQSLDIKAATIAITTGDGVETLKLTSTAHVIRAGQPAHLTDFKLGEDVIVVVGQRRRGTVYARGLALNDDAEALRAALVKK